MSAIERFGILAIFFSFLGFYFLRFRRFRRRLHTGTKDHVGNKDGRAMYATNTFKVSVICFLVGLIVGVPLGGLVVLLLGYNGISDGNVANLLLALATIPTGVAVEICFLDSEQLIDKRFTAFQAAFIGGILIGVAIILI